MTSNQLVETGCCPRFNPEPWQGRVLHWQDKPFVRDRVRSLFHVPLDFGRVMTRNTKAIEAAGSFDADHLVLCDEQSPWGTDVFLAVAEPISGLQMVTITGTFLATVHEGSYREVGGFLESAMRQASERGIAGTDQVYFWYTTCPKCAKAYGENYIVIFVGTKT